MTPPLRPRAAVAAAGATALLASLLVPTAAAADGASAPLEDLLISEYVEGTSNNKAVELYNGTGAAIDLAGYKLEQYSNGGTNASPVVPLTGTVAPGDVFVLAHSSSAPEVRAVADQTTGAGLFNGNDALILRGPAGQVVDSFGQVGFDPGVEWGTGLTSTADNTLRRKADVCAGDTNPADVFDPAVEWDGYPVNTFDGLGSHTTTCEGGEPQPTPVVINEFSASTAGTDVEYLEVLGAARTDYSGLSILQVEGDATSAARGSVVTSHPLGTTDADGRWHVDLAANTLENGTLTLLLVEGTVEPGTVLDADRDGTIDVDLTVVDGVAVHDGGAGDLTYADVVLGVEYDGLPFAPGGASRIPDGQDTGSATDWVRNDFDLAGIPGFTGTLVDGEAVNTPGAANTTTLPGGGGPGAGSCYDEATLIGAVQGSGPGSPVQGSTVTVEGTVVGDFQHAGSYDGYYVQDAGDGDPATSDGIFVYAPGGRDVSVGDRVRVTGPVSEYFSLTQITASDVQLCATGQTLPEATVLTLPVTDPERYESMLVTFPQDLSILEYFEYGRFGQIVLGVGDGTPRQYQPTAVHEPGSAEAGALLEHNRTHRIMLDDGLNAQNPAFLRHPNGERFTLENSFRGGDTVSDVTGVLDYRFSKWGIQPTEGATHTERNPRPAVPEVGGTSTVASFNVLNYFTTLGSRGADTAQEFTRQQAKIVAAIDEMDADVVGLIEIENNGDVAVGNLVDALNAQAGSTRWAFVSTGIVGTDAITTAFIYQPARVTPVGRFAVLDSTVDPRFDDRANRPALAQTFRDATGGQVTVVNNHLKSKGSACAGDPDTGQGNCNLTRAAAADALGDWANDDPTGTGVEEVLIIGDLNSYDKEDPIDALRADGYVDLLARFQGELAYSYVFDGMLGYLDYALASAELSPRVTGAAAWTINADEPPVLDYDLNFKPAAQQELYAADPFRSSDHDPILVGLDLTPPDTTAPELEVVASPSSVWPPNNQWVDVDTVVQATDDSGEAPTVTLVGAVVTDPGRNGKGEIEVVSDSRLRVRASVGAVYTVTYEATDAAGNSTTASATVTVGRPAAGGRG